MMTQSVASAGGRGKNSAEEGKAACLMSKYCYFQSEDFGVLTSEDDRTSALGFHLAFSLSRVTRDPNSSVV